MVVRRGVKRARPPYAASMPKRKLRVFAVSLRGESGLRNGLRNRFEQPLALRARAALTWARQIELVQPRNQRAP